MTKLSIEMTEELKQTIVELFEKNKWKPFIKYGITFAKLYSDSKESNLSMDVVDKDDNAVQKFVNL